MQAYSEDLRLRIVVAVDGGMPRSEAARVFRVGRATVKRYLALRRETGALAPRPRPGSPPWKTAVSLRAESGACQGIRTIVDQSESYPDYVNDEAHKATRLAP